MNQQPADLLVVGGSVVTRALGGPARPATVAIRAGVIVGLGASCDELRGPRTEILDVRGAVVTPGLVDGHTHPVMGVDLAGGADLTACRTLGQVRSALASHTRARPDDEWITAWGLDPNVFGDNDLTNTGIEEAVNGRPALVHLFDGHSALVTNAALARAGIDGARELPGGAAVVVDSRGVPTGHLLEEAAVDLVADRIPPAPFAERKRRLKELLSAMGSTGLTGGHVMDAKSDATALLAALDEADELPMRLRLAPWFRPGDDPGAVLQAQELGGRMWKVAGVKLFLDGTIDGGTAWLSSPDCFGQSTAGGWIPEEYRRCLERFDAAGAPTATHAIGDAAIRHALDSLASLPPRPGGPRHRIEHLETMPGDLIPRFAEQGVAASMQPRHATDFTAADGSDNWSRRIGPERAGQGWRCADVLRAGGTLILGSDWPVSPYDPRAVMAAAILRRRPDDSGAVAVQPDQALTPEQALHACTAAPSQLAGSRGGEIRIGFDADLTVFAEDPRITPPAQLPDLPVQQTISGGRVTFRATD